MHEYFPDNYGWSLSFMMALEMGAPLSELVDACRPLEPLAATPGAEADRAWFDAFRALGERTERYAAGDLEAGRRTLARRRYLRAAGYLLLAERQVTKKDDDTLSTYRRGLDCFRRGAEAAGAPVEFVEVPYGEHALPCLFLPAQADGPAPCMVHFDGLDVMKELIYLMGVERLPEQGVSVLICDHPGVGEARRLRGLPAIHDTERPAAACVDWLERRGDVDDARVGIMALSLGGYYAPRAAAFEPRFSACVLWGAVWDAEEVDGFQRSADGAASVDLAQQFAWVFDTDPESATRELHRFKLEHVIDQIACPLLVVHGENDRQVPLSTAQRTYEAAVSSARRELKVFSIAEGGSAHCQIDDLAVGTAYMFDWIADVWNAQRSRVVDQVVRT